MTETDLVIKLKSSEAGSFKELVDLYQNKVINTCYRFVFNKEDAEDIAQEVFIEVHRSIGSFREESKLSTWIYRISITKSLDFLRKKKRKKRIGYFSRVFGMEENLEQVPMPDKNNPETIAVNKERFQILQTAIDSLAENQRIALTLSKYEGYSYQEIADIMATSLSAVESLIHRAKKNLEKKLFRYYKKTL